MALQYVVWLSIVVSFLVELPPSTSFTLPSESTCASEAIFGLPAKDAFTVEFFFLIIDSCLTLSFLLTASLS